jgi:Ni,Fe-hydrogenase III small subunit
LRVDEVVQACIRALLGRTLCIGHFDDGSSNGCELEIHALGNPTYNAEGLGIKFVASPRHADLLLVTAQSQATCDCRSSAPTRRCPNRSLQ